MGQKEFPPSIKRLNKARREGKTPKSRMVSLAVSWWSLILVLFPAFAWVRNGTLVQWCNYKVWNPQVALVEASWLGLRVLVPMIGAIAVSGCVVGLFQSRGLLLPAQLVKGIDAYLPSTFVKKVGQGLLDASLGLVRCAFLAAVLFPILMMIASLTPSSYIGLTSEAEVGFHMLVRSALTRGGVVLMLFAVVGYSLARWRFYKGLRMSLQELKDEHKDEEGDPHAKASRKHEHKMLLMSEIEKRIKRSKVVVVRKSKTQVE
jgi:flagellar biosynthesis protein FlhB